MVIPMGEVGSAEPAPVGFPGKTDPKMAHVGFSTQHPAIMEVTLQVALLPAAGRGSALAPLCHRFCLVPVFDWEINNLESAPSIPRDERSWE